MSDNLLDFLNQFVSLTPEDYKELVGKLETKTFKKGEFITRIGEQEQFMYFVLKGLTRKFFYRGNHEIITHIAKEGNIVGAAVSFLSGKPSKYMIQALEPVTLLAISRENLETLYQSDKKWERVGRIISTHFFIVLETRVLDNIRFPMRERYEHFIQQQPDLLGRVPQKYLASYLNIKPETFSRLKGQLKSEKKEFIL